ncbi:MAG: hypothetical protein M3077_05845 [Candidatus Dormibacteraeota bacterium]|nr:hypothetical protein [Candidatus Dormibacteraeota bacterium]
MSRFIAATSKITGPAHVRRASATALPYGDASFDYCFTDPPFGANIIYSDCSLLWEAWLGDFTDKSSEAVMNQQGKGLERYADLMRESFREVHRVLKPRALTTVVFQNTDPSVWDALVAATVDAGFALEDVHVLHKVQPSFKGVKAQEEGERVAASDVVLTLRRAKRGSAQLTIVGFEPIWAAVTEELRRTDLSKRQRGSGHLYAVAIAAAVTSGIPATHTTFEALEAWLGETCERTSEGWQLREVAVGV